MAQATELSCGGCGESKMRLRGVKAGDGRDLWLDIAVVCSRCGSVTHLLPMRTIELEWGRIQEGEQADGLLCPLPWKDGDK